MVMFSNDNAKFGVKCQAVTFRTEAYYSHYRTHHTGKYPYHVVILFIFFIYLFIYIFIYLSYMKN